MRALIVFLALAVAVVICMAFVTLFAGINVGTAVLGSIGLGVFMVGALFAAIAALGPKSRPTPLLTPTIAGTTAVLLTTVALIAGTTHLGNAYRSALRAGEPERIAAPEPEVAAPVPKAPETGPEPIQFPGVTILPSSPLPGGPASAMSDGTTPPAPMADPQAANAEPPAGEPLEAPAPMTPQPDLTNTLADIPEPMAPQSSLADAAGDDSVIDPAAAEASNAAPTTPQEPTETGTSPTVTPIPIPPPRPTRLVLSEQPFDTTAPPAPPGSQPSANPPSATGPTSASPPLPRSRPCGAGGPPCP